MSAHYCTVYLDSEMQNLAGLWANSFNELDPEPLINISFVQSYVLELVDRPGRPLCGCERFIDGDFQKHNNNVGAAVISVQKYDEADISAIAQAFSHYTYEASNRQLLVCDIQGAISFATGFASSKLHFQVSITYLRILKFTLSAVKASAKGIWASLGLISCLFVNNVSSLSTQNARISASSQVQSDLSSLRVKSHRSEASQSSSRLPKRCASPSSSFKQKYMNHLNEPPRILF